MAEGTPAFTLMCDVEGDPKPKADILFLKHDSCILRQSSNPVWFMEEPSQFSVDQTAQSLTCFITERPHTGLFDCLRILLSCFRKRMSGLDRAVVDCLLGLEPLRRDSQGLDDGILLAELIQRVKRSGSWITLKDPFVIFQVQ